jgi:hypothetical protein
MRYRLLLAALLLALLGAAPAYAQVPPSQPWLVPPITAGDCLAAGTYFGQIVDAGVLCPTSSSMLSISSLGVGEAAPAAGVVDAATSFQIGNANVATAPGQFVGVSSNTAATAGNIGELISAQCPNSSSGTATFTNGISDIGMTTTPPIGCPINFTTSNALPTNFATGTNYFVVERVAGTSVEVSGTIGGTAIVAGSAGAGTQTAVYNAILSSNSSIAIVGVSLTAGDWDCSATEAFLPATTTTHTEERIAITNSSTTFPTPPTGAYTQLQLTFTTQDNQNIQVGPAQFLLSGAASIWLITDPIFATSTAAADGMLRCRRTH